MTSKSRYSLSTISLIIRFKHVTYNANKIELQITYFLKILNISTLRSTLLGNGLKNYNAMIIVGGENGSNVHQLNADDTSAEEIGEMKGAGN